MDSDPEPSWRTVFRSCLPARKRSNPGETELRPQKVTPRPDEISLPTNEVTPPTNETAPYPDAARHPVQDVPSPAEAALHTDNASSRPDEVTHHQNEIVSHPDGVAPSSGEATPIATTANVGDGSKTKNHDGWEAMRLALQGLQGALDGFPPLKIAVGGLLGSMIQLQIADHNRREYERLASSLESLAGILQKHLTRSDPTDSMRQSLEEVGSALEEQVKRIQQRKDRSRTRQLIAARSDEDEILDCYRQVEALFRQLQADISLETLDIVRKEQMVHREEQMEKHLKSLSPAEDAWFNSCLSENMTKRRACTANTRTKVLGDAYIWTLDQEAAKIYWMNGMAGTGKTTIAYSLCKKLEEEKHLGASFFCSRDSASCRDVNKIVPTIAYQLGRYSNLYLQAVCKVLGDKRDVEKKDIETQFENLIAGPLESVKDAMPSGVVVVIDALDECDDINGTKRVLDLLFQHATKLPLKFFVTSRPEPSIVNKMDLRDDTSRSILRLHDIAEFIVQADIRTYLNEALESIHPSATALKQLTTRAGHLFIFAATAVRFIIPDDDDADPQERLQAILSTPAVRTPIKYEELDALYTTILSKALGGSKLQKAEAERRVLVLRTVVCAREPSTAATLAELLGLQGDQQVRSAIQSLRSVLHMSEGSGVISTLHASFPDFLLSKERSKTFHCGEAEHNKYLSTRCFDVMKHSLRFNICGLETSSRLDKDVPDLQNRIDNAISSGLFYACRYWGDHSFNTSASVALVSQLDEFLRYRLLFWMEALNLKGWIGHCETMLSQALSWLPTGEASTELRQFTYDARNFVTTFASNPTSLSTPHIYQSVLPFTMNQSLVRTNYWPRTRGLLRVEDTGMESRGRAALATWTVGPGVMSIAQPSDGKRIVSWSNDDTVSIWDVSKGTRIVGPLPGSQSQSLNWGTFAYSRSVAFSVDGTRIASGSEDRTIRLWDAHSDNLITHPLEGHTEPVLSVAFSPDSTRLISGSRDHSIRMWDARNGNQLGNIFQGHQDAVQSVVFSPDGKRIASGSSDSTIRIWDVQSATTTVRPIEGHTDWVYSVAFSPDGLRIVSGSFDQTVCVWDANSGDILAGPFEGHTQNVSSVAFSPDGRRVVSGSWDCTIRMWDSQNGALLAGPLEGHHKSVNSVLFSTDGIRILSGSDDGTICVWDARHGTTAAAKSSGHTAAIYSVAFSPDGTRAVSGSRDRTIRVWDTRKGRLVVGPLEGHTSHVRSVAFSPDGAQIASGSADRTIRTWDANSGASIGDSFEGHTSWVWSVAYSPDGCRIASGSTDQTIRVWDSQTGKTVAGPFMGHTNGVRSIAWSPDGTRIVSGSSDRTVRMWNAQAGVALWTSDDHAHWVNCVAYSPDGTRVVSGSQDCTILVLNAANGIVLHGTLEGHTGRIWSVAFSPDGTRIVSGSWDNTACVWDAQNGTLVSGPFKGHTSYVRSVAFSPDGRRVVSSSDDSTILFWDVATADHFHPAYFDHYAPRDDGWVTHSDSQLLVWLPPDLRGVVPRCSPIISPRGVIHADYNDLLVGERWNECYHDSTNMTVP